LVALRVPIVQVVAAVMYSAHTILERDHDACAQAITGTEGTIWNVAGEVRRIRMT